MTNEEAIKGLELIARETVWNDRREAVEMAIDALQHDTVDVVLCKDCKYYYYADNRIPSEREWACANDGCYVSPNDYCSWGERRDDK